MTNYDLIKKLANNNSSDENDDSAFQDLLRQCGFYKCVIVCGIAYLNGYGEPFAVNDVARKLIELLPNTFI